MQQLSFGDEGVNWILFWTHLILSAGLGGVVFGLVSFKRSRRAKFRESLGTISRPIGALLGVSITILLLWGLGIGHWSVFYSANLRPDDTFSVTYQVPENTIDVNCDDVTSIEVLPGRERYRRVLKRGWRVVLHTSTDLRLRSALIEEEREAYDAAALFCPARDDLATVRP